MNIENYILAMNKIILLVIIVNVLISCFSGENIDKRDFSVYVPEVDIHMTTSKRKGGVFYVMFDDKKQINKLSDSIDYIKFDTKGFITIIFDTVSKDCVYIFPAYKPDSVNQVKYQLELIENSTWEGERARFYDYPGNKIENAKLKPRYRIVYIEPKYYTIELNNKTLKKGNVLGGWRGN